jgi:hypothetical protein
VVLAAVIALGQALTGRSVAQEQAGQKIPFHVTAVRSEDAHDVCAKDSDCTATRFTMEGYSAVKNESVEYVCVEILADKPSPHLLVECDRVHARNDYLVRLMPDAIAFGGVKPRSTDGPGRPAYRIISEKERTPQK